MANLYIESPWKSAAARYENHVMDLSLKRVLSYFHYRWHQRVTLGDEFHAPLLELLALLRPMRARKEKKIRLGSGRDGGYVMLDDFENIDAGLSLGIGPDVSWDLAMTDRGIPVWQFDHTVAAPPAQNPSFHFEPRRIVSQPTLPGDMIFADLLQQQGVKQIVVKMDIEGDEWDVLASLPPGSLGNCRQLVLELHDFLSISDPGWRERATKALLAMSVEFAVVHVHGNNLSKHIVTGGLDLPDSLEVTFANRAYYQFEATEEDFPGPEDRKNNPYFPDFHLGRFQFNREGKAP